MTDALVKTCPCGSTMELDVTGFNTAAIAFARKMFFQCDACQSKEKQETADRMMRQARIEHERRVGRSGLPSQHQIPLDQLDHPPELLKACADWAGNGGGLLLTGEIGVGKTTLAGAAVYAMSRCRAVLWVPVSLLFSRLSTPFNSGPHTWATEALSGDMAIALDDLDKTRPSEYAAEQIFTAIDHRVQHEIPLLVTTNFRLSELAEKWPAPIGESIASRLVGYCRVLRVAGVDRRLGAKSIETRSAA